MYYFEMISDGERFEEAVTLKQQIEQMAKEFNETEKKVFLLRMNGETQCAIAKICGISQTQVSRIIKKCKEEI